jgi:PhoPQ-activated pathogenicity-related protein
MRSPRGFQIAAVVDPYSYRDRLSLPKLLIHGLNDGYWATDALNLYWDDLVGDKHVLYAPNQPHTISDRRNVRPTVAAFVRAALRGACLPDVTAHFDEQGRSVEVAVRCSAPALDARAWRAVSPHQDFRAAQWVSTPLSHRADGVCFSGMIERPSHGYVAIVAECRLPDEHAAYRLSSQVRIFKGTAD